MDETDRLLIQNNNYKFFKDYLCNPTHFSHRVIILLLTSFIAFGSFFCYDNPAALQSMLIRDLELSFTSYMSLYAWYSWPNVIMSFIGGFLIDNLFGLRIGTIIFGSLTMIGQLLFALGVYVNELWLMDLSRLIFGIGAESLAVAQNTYAAMWFKDKELNIVFGLQISISRLGSTINSNTMGELYRYLTQTYSGKTSLALSLVIASSTCFLSLIFCLILGYLDLRAFKIIKPLSSQQIDNKIRLSDVFKFKRSLWACCFICFMFYATVFPFVSLAQTFYVNKYALSVSQANFANSIIYIVSAIVSPILGFGVDYFGRNLIWLTVGLMLLIFGHILSAFTFNVSPFVISTVMGLAYSQVASSLWGLVTYIVPKERQGTAYGLMQAIMNLGLGSISLLSGELLDNYGYLSVELLFISCLLIGFILLLYLFKWDMANNDVLNSSQKQRLKHSKRME